MSNNVECYENLISYIKSVILKYCPYTEDRLSILGDAKSRALDIKFIISNKESQIFFHFGESSFKRTTPERATTTYLISFDEISEVIDFIISDHEVIHKINIFDRGFELGFAINWSEENIKGIDCGDIGLSFSFESKELQKEYLYFLFKKYYTNLEKTEAFKIIKNEYLNNIKHYLLDSLDKEELLLVLNGMSEKELKDLLYGLDNDTFSKYFASTNQKTIVKNKLLEEHV